MDEIKKILWGVFFVIVLVLILDRADKVKELETGTVDALDKFIGSIRG